LPISIAVAGKLAPVPSGLAWHRTACRPAQWRRARQPDAL